MATKTRELFTSPIGRFINVYLNEPRDYKNNGKFAYDVELVLEGDDAQTFMKQVDQWYETAILNAPREEDPKTGELGPPKAQPAPYRVMKEKGDDGVERIIPGVFAFKFKLKQHTKTQKGDIWTREPVFIDSAGNFLEGNNRPFLGAGTEGRIQFSTYMYNQPAAGLQLQPEQVQIVKLVEGRSRKMEAIEGGYVAGDEAAGTTATDPVDEADEY